MKRIKFVNDQLVKMISEPLRGWNESVSEESRGQNELEKAAGLL